MIKVLFEQVATPGQLEPLGLVEVLDWTAAALNRVDRAEFREQFQEQQAVQYFYEPFLKAFDPELRKELGVWFTPVEIVKYMVARTDRVLREELGLQDGLADKNVYILDPACGTGAYLVEVLKTIAATMTSKGNDAFTAHDVKKAAMERVFGFEILPAPFVISHLQLGLLLQNLGAPLADDTQERVSVYLTNSLTGWEPPKGAKVQLTLPEMQAERDAADTVKRTAPVLVVIGNPPYNAFAGISPEEEEGLVEVYKGIYWVDKVNPKTGKTVKDRSGNPVRQRRYRLNDPESRGGWGIKKFNLDDLYVRFFRLAERRIAEMTGRGVVCYISNHSYITEPSFVILREHLLGSFNKIWIENLHGDRKRSEYAPDGHTSETIFAMSGFSPGIKQGVATTLCVKTGESTLATVMLRDDIDSAKAAERRARLLKTLTENNFSDQYSFGIPTKDNRYSFWPMKVDPHYLQWPIIIELCQFFSNGLMEKRGSALIDADSAALSERMQTFFNPKLEWADFRASCHPLSKKYARFDPKKAREKALEKEQFSADRIVRYALRPFDVQFCYSTPIRPVWNEPRPLLAKQAWDGNWFLLTRLRAGKDPEGVPVHFTPFLSDDHILAPDAIAIPAALRIQKVGIRGALFENENADSTDIPNLSPPAALYLKELGFDVQEGGFVLWMHLLAIGCSHAYLSENADGARRNWPRIPLPSLAGTLLKSGKLGEQLANLLNPDAAVEGVTMGPLRPEIGIVGVITSTGENPLDPTKDLNLTRGWGHKTKSGVNPGKGEAEERDYTAEELTALSKVATGMGLALDEVLKLLGGKTFDVYLNDHVYWKNVPSRVWGYYVGGYQVIKKWLSYRETKILGRPITIDEARHVRDVARRIAAICLLQPALDANYATVKADTYDWPSADKSTQADGPLPAQ